MAKLFDARGDLDWGALTDAEFLDECYARSMQALAAFTGQPITDKVVEAITRTLNRVRVVIELEMAGMRRDWAEAIADDN
jgi:hypothetical protein